MVKMMKSSTLAKAFEVASLQESIVKAIQKFQKPKGSTPIQQSPYSSKPPEEIKAKDPSPKPNKSPNGYKTISPTDFQTKGNLGL